MPFLTTQSGLLTAIYDIIPYKPNFLTLPFCYHKAFRPMTKTQQVSLLFNYFNLLYFDLPACNQGHIVHHNSC